MNPLIFIKLENHPGKPYKNSNTTQDYLYI
jgi:hypothetical protein